MRDAAWERRIKPLHALFWLGSLLLLAACQPVSQSLAPATSHAALLADKVQLPDGSELALRRWMPEKAPRALILALHGFNDYSHSFALPGAALAHEGVGMIAIDQRGFGRSPQPGIWPGSDNLVRDVRWVLALLQQQYPGTPLYLLGESMGGAVAVEACRQGACDQLSGLILSAPALWGNEGFASFYRFTLWLAAHTIPGSEWTGEDLEILASDNLPMLYAMGNDPLVIKHTRVDAIYGLVGLMGEAYRSVEKLSLPILLLYGAQDEVIPRDPIASAIDRIRAPLTVAFYRQGYHMLLRDNQRAVVYADLLSWLTDRYRLLPSGADMGWKEELLPPRDE